jgi:protein-S-isoprenylcysteine O-methyltransferase Ste14
VCSAVLAVSSVLTLRLRGKPTDAWESTTVLFTGGVYRFVRHPLYTSAILLMIGCPLVRPTVVSIILFVVSTSAFVLAAHFEDELNVAKFGDEYEKYRLRLFRILPPLY